MLTDAEICLELSLLNSNHQQNLNNTSNTTTNNLENIDGNFCQNSMSNDEFSTVNLLQLQMDATNVKTEVYNNIAYHENNVKINDSNHNDNQTNWSPPPPQLNANKHYKNSHEITHDTTSTTTFVPTKNQKIQKTPPTVQSQEKNEKISHSKLTANSETKFAILKRNQILRMKGEEYVGFTKHNKRVQQDSTRQARSIGPTCNSPLCRKSKERNCDYFSEQLRMEIFQKFWSTLDWDQRKVFVCTHVNLTDVKKKQKKVESRRSNSLFYFLPSNKGPIQVCRYMFLNTLSIGRYSVLTWVKNTDPDLILSLKHHVNIIPTNNDNAEEEKEEEEHDDEDLPENTLFLHDNVKSVKEVIESELNDETESDIFIDSEDAESSSKEIDSKLTNSSSKCLKNKVLRMKGEAYLGYTRKNKIVKQNSMKKARTIGPTCNLPLCKKSTERNCHYFSEKLRMKIFTKFWKKLDWTERKQFVCDHVNISYVKNKTSKLSSKKLKNLFYFLPCGSGKLQVCRKMFLNTLAVGRYSVRGWVKNSLVISGE